MWRGKSNLQNLNSTCFCASFPGFCKKKALQFLYVYGILPYVRISVSWSEATRLTLFYSV